MKFLRTILLLILMGGCSTGNEKTQENVSPADLANPLIDSHKSRYDYFISAAVPYGMVCLYPDTRHGELWNTGYMYKDEYILDFSHIHNAQTAGIPVMPVTGPCKGNLGLEANRSRFSHDKETAKAGYHKVYLEDSKITAELTATSRTGVHRYSFPETSEAHFIFDLCAPQGPTKMLYGYARKTADNEIEGYSVMAPTFRRKKQYVAHFVAQFSKPFDDFSGWKLQDTVKKMVIPENGIIRGEESGIYVTYNNLKEGEEIILKVAISYVSADNARLNLEAEVPHWDFDRVAEEARKSWNDYLGRIEVSGGTEAQRIKFYTDLMHTASKRISSDVDGSYADWTGPQPVMRKLPLDAKGKPLRPFLDGDGLWGSQWNLNILWPLVYPEYGNWMAETFLEFYRNAGMMSRASWGGNYIYVMVGDHSVPLIASMMSTGRATFDKDLAYAGARKNAFPGGIRDRAGYEASPNPSGGGIDWYVEKGYVPVEIKDRGDGFHRGGTSMTIEYAFQDWCIASMARQLGKTDDHELFMKRSENWRNVFDTSTGWARARQLNGEWFGSSSPLAPQGQFNSVGFVEGSGASYTFYVPQNISGLIESMGGKDAFITRLDSNFIKAKPVRFVLPHGQHGSGWVDYENQPSCEMAHLFSHAGAPWLTQYWVRQVKELTFGGTDPFTGYLGDEDQGQMGALSALMSIGLFDVQGCVGENPQLEITSPVFDKVIMRFPSIENAAKTTLFEIITTRKNPDDIYIQNVKLNGKTWESFEFSVSDYMKGGKLEIELGPEPNKNWGITKND
jgi:predicted alpha-1,2-mannosidase